MPSGSKPGERRGGRQLGSKNRLTVERELRAKATAEAAFAAGVLPLDIMLADMRAKYVAGDLAGAADRARDCAPYVHPRLASATIKRDDPFADMTRADIDGLVAQLRLGLKVTLDGLEGEDDEEDVDRRH